MKRDHPIIECDTQYLDLNTTNRFFKVVNKTKECYSSAIMGFMKTIENLVIGLPPFLPKLYIIPFVFLLKSGNNHYITINLTTNDPNDSASDPKDQKEKVKIAFFPTLPFLERAPDKFITASFARELSHWLYNYINGTPELENGVDIIETAIKLEDGIDDYFKFFGEPVKTWLEEWSDSTGDFLKTTFKDLKNFRTFTTTEELNDYLYGSY